MQTREAKQEAEIEEIIKALDRGDKQLAAQLFKREHAKYQYKNFGTILHYYVYQNNPLIIEWLCCRYSEHSISIDQRGSNWETPLQLAYRANFSQIVKILRRYTLEEEPLLHWYITRQMVGILGKNYLEDKGFDINQRIEESAQGGWIHESTQVLSAAICKYAEGKPEFAPIVKIIRNFCANEQPNLSGKEKAEIIIEKANNRERRIVLFATGYTGHGFAVGLRKMEAGYMLSFYDRNKELNVPRVKRFFAEEDMFFIQSIVVPKNQIQQIILTLLELHFKEKAAYEKWFAELPKLVQKEYQFDKRRLLDPTRNERHRCYWINMQYAVHHLFLETLGEERGKKEFTQFLAFIENEALEHYKLTKHYAKHVDQVRNLREEIQQRMKPEGFWSRDRKKQMTKIFYGLLITTGVILLLASYGVPLFAALTVLASQHVLGTVGWCLFGLPFWITAAKDVWGGLKKIARKCQKYFKATDETHTTNNAPVFSSHADISKKLEEKQHEAPRETPQESFAANPTPSQQAAIPNPPATNHSAFFQPSISNEEPSLSHDICKLWKIPTQVF